MRGRFGRPTLAGILLLLAAGCHRAELEEQRARLDREHAERMASLERLEARLYHSLKTVRLWEELGARHEQVSEFACENMAAHAEAMERHRQRFHARIVDTRLARADTGKTSSSN